MRRTTPKLTPSEQRKIDSAKDLRDRKAQVARDKAEKALEALRRKEDEIGAKLTAEIVAAHTEFMDVEDAVYRAIFQEEGRTGVQRDPAA